MYLTWVDSCVLKGGNLRSFKEIDKAMFAAVDAFEAKYGKPKPKAEPVESDAEKLLRLEDDYKHQRLHFDAIAKAEFDLTLRRIAEGKLVAETYAQIQLLRQTLGVEDGGKYGSQDTEEHIKSLRERQADEEADFRHDQQVEARLVGSADYEEGA